MLVPVLFSIQSTSIRILNNQIQLFLHVLEKGTEQQLLVTNRCHSLLTPCHLVAFCTFSLTYRPRHFECESADDDAGELFVPTWVFSCDVISVEPEQNRY